MAYIISPDKIKESLPEYDPERSQDFHHESTRLADKDFSIALKGRSEDSVILMSGGSASGKSEYVSAYLENSRNAIIYDGTLPTLEGARIKFRQAKAAEKSVEVVAVVPVDLRIAYLAFLNRSRKYPSQHFFSYTFAFSQHLTSNSRCIARPTFNAC